MTTLAINAPTKLVMIRYDGGAGNQRNYGALNVCAYGQNVRGLIQFSLDDLPEAAVISSATLSLNQNYLDEPTAQTCQVYRLKRS